MTSNEKMESKFIVKGRLHAPYFIYFKANRELSDEEILKTFDLDGFESTNEEGFRKQIVHVATSPTWSLIADDWCYSLAFSDEIKKKVKSISQDFDVYECWVGDTGYEYNFTLYKRGEIIRAYSYWGGWGLSGKYKDQARVERDVGEPLPGELGMNDKEDEYDVIFDIALYQGINPKINLTARSYSKSKPRPERKGFSIGYLNLKPAKHDVPLHYS